MKMYSARMILNLKEDEAPLRIKGKSNNPLKAPSIATRLMEAEATDRQAQAGKGDEKGPHHHWQMIMPSSSV